MVNAREFLRLRPGRDLLVLFALTILLPGLVLAAFSGRALLQERNFATQQLRERLDRAAERTSRDIERELREWQVSLGRLDPTLPVAASVVPDRLRVSLTDPGAAIVLFAQSSGMRAWPERQLLYQPITADSVTAVEDDAVAEAELIELREKDYAKAIVAYERLRGSADAARRTLALHRLGRTYRKAGRQETSLRAFQELERSTERIAGIPADLIAKYEICAHWSARNDSEALAGAALGLYADLVGGRWPMDRSRYSFYADTARGWLDRVSPHATALLHLHQLEEKKRVLTEAATAVADVRDAAAFPATHLVIQGGDGSGTTLLVARDWLNTKLWPHVFGALTEDGLDGAIISDTGEALFTSATDAAINVMAASPAASRPMQIVEASWQLRVWPRNPDAVWADVSRRQTLFLVMLIVVVASLGSGAYLIARVVRRELEIAQLKSDFVSTVSHEFRSPLTGIRQLGEMLKLGRVPSGARRQEYYDRIIRESDRLARLVENVLDFSRMEEGRKQYRFAPVDAACWLKSVVTDFQNHVSDGVTVVATIPDSLPSVVADADALTCAIHNLLDNAVKYSPGRDSVWLEAVPANSHVTVSVRDAGIGISDDDQKRVFEKFYRGRADITREVKGAGLGLSLVHHIVAAHGGHVECRSRLGEGTTFSIHLKAAGA
jgi:signal transduction histidine kinase